MKRRLVLSVLAMLAATGLSHADGLVLPQTLTVTNVRGKTSIPLTTSTLFTRGSSILFTNCVAFAGTSTNAARQDLTGGSHKLILSDGTTSSTNDVAAINATNGTWWALGTVPEAADPCYWQLFLQDAQTNSYFYLQEKFQTQPHL